MIVEEQCRAWMLAARRGDQAAYRRLLEALDPWLRALHAAECRRQDAEDLAQETLLAIHLKRHTYDASQPLLAWAAAIARYKRIDYYRRRGRRREVAWSDQQAERAAPAAKTSGDQDLRREVESLLAQLPSEQAAAVRAVKIEGLSVAETASRLSRSVSWVKVNIHRGLRSLRRHAGVNSHES